MSNTGGCCGGGVRQQAVVEPTREESKTGSSRTSASGIIDYNVTMLIAAGGAIAANCEPCINKVVPDLSEAKVAEADIRKAVAVGQFVKNQSAKVIMETANDLLKPASSASSPPRVKQGGGGATKQQLSCSETIEQGIKEFLPDGDVAEIGDSRVALLVAAGAAIAANCESCLAEIVLDLRRKGTADSEIRRAIEIGMFVKDKPADIMKEAADVLTGTRMSKQPVEFECPGDKMKGAGCG